MRIDDILRLNYSKTHSIAKAAAITGFHRNTVKARYAAWDADAIAEFESKLKKGETQFQIEYLNLTQALIDEQLTTLDEVKSDIEQARANASDTLPQLFSIKNQIIKTLQTLNEKRLAMKIYPGAIRMVDQIIDTKMRDHVQFSNTN